jgi:hypothetical protein
MVMTVSALPVDQRVIDIDSRRFASVEKALVELVTNCDDSYSRLEKQELTVSGKISISYERHQKGAVLTVTDQAEGMTLPRIRSVLSYGGAHSAMAQGEAGGRGYFGRGLKQAVYGLGHGWIESTFNGQLARIDLFRDEKGAYLFDDWDHDRYAQDNDYTRLGLPPDSNGSRVTIIIENQLVNIPYFGSLAASVSNNIYLRDVLRRRSVELINLNQAGKQQVVLPLHYEEPEAEVLIGPDASGSFKFGERFYDFTLSLKKALNSELVLKGDERTNGLLVLSGAAVFDCQFFQFENQLGTEFLFGTVICPGLAEMLAAGHPIISDEREGLNGKEPFVAAFAAAVSTMIADVIKREQIRLSHIDHATTSRRTQSMIEKVLQLMNQAAVEDLGIRLPPGPGSGRPGPYDTGRPAVLRFSTPFYHRLVGHAFHIALIVDRSQLLEQELVSFSYEMPDSIKVEPQPEALLVVDIPADGRWEWELTGNAVGVKGRIEASCGPFAAVCEIVIAETAGGYGYGHPSGRAPRLWNMDNSTDLFSGYELRNLNNDMERAIYSPDERLILINTEAPTVRLYVNGQGHFKDGARLLLAELLLDVITEEMARRYVDRSTRQGEPDTYRQVKHNLIRRYGVEIHSILLGE